jgi:hypothetical protein
VIQLVFVLRLNRLFFRHVTQLNFNPVYKLGVFIVVAMTGCAWVAFTGTAKSLTQTGVFTLIAIIVLAGIAYPLFKLNEMSRIVIKRLVPRP